MSMTPEQSRILAAKPLARVRRFAALLNWHGLQLLTHVFAADEVEELYRPPLGILFWYMTPDVKFNLQINEHPLGQSITHQASVKAIRYGVSNNGWHPFVLSERDDELHSEAERLRSKLDRRLWKNSKWRREFAANHPVLLPPSRKKRRGNA